MPTFDNDEAGYLKWVGTHPDGFVLNVPRQRNMAPNMMHRASCKHITTSERTNYTTTDYFKVCATNRQELLDWAAGDSNRLQTCQHCNP